MPLDPRIPLAIQPPPPPRDPFARMAELGAIKQQMEAQAAQQRAIEADRAVRDIMARYPNDPDRTLQALEQGGYGPEAVALAGKYAENRKKTADALKTDLDNQLSTFDLASRVLSSADERTYPLVRQMLSTIQGVGSLLPEQYDPSAIERLMSVGMTAKDTLAQRAKAVERLRSGEDKQALAEYLATVQSPEEYQQVLQMAPQLGFADSVIGLFDPEFSPAAIEKARTMALTEKQRADLAMEGQKEARMTAAEEARRLFEQKRLQISQGQLAVAQGNLAVRQREADKPPASAKATLTPNEALRTTRSLRNDFLRETKSAQEVERQLAAMEDSLRAVKSGAAAPGSQGVLVTFQKILDPISVVRESEYARSAAGLSLWSRLQGQWMVIQEGGAKVPVHELEKFVALAREWAKNQRAFTKETQRQIDGIADEYGLRKEFITRDIGPPQESSEAAPQRPIPGIPGGVAEYRDGKWIRIK